MDGDGNLDIVASYFRPGGVGVLYGRGDGTFTSPQNYRTGQTQGFQVSVGDLNGDGAPDVISENILTSISVLLNQATAKATLTNVAVPGTAGDSETIVANYGGDGRYKKSASKPLEITGSGNK
jgi:hypothetical protein